jgi:hypothetical protein
MQRVVMLLLVIAGGWTQSAAAEQEREAYVARAQFTTAVKQREPVDQLVVGSPPLEQVFFFTDLRHMEGHTVVHNWRYHGELVGQVKFDVRGPRWRVYSKRTINSGEYGEWTVTVTDEAGWPMYTELFRYQRDGGATAAGEGLQAQ